jgi:Tfp pilus assembly major pilin PilA
MSKAKRGITLIEIVLAIGLTVVMAGFVVAGYNNYNKNQKVITVAARLMQVFKTAKSNALAHKINCDVCGGVDGTCNGFDDYPLTGWSVSIIPGTVNPGYRIDGICGGGYFMTKIETFPGVEIEVQNGPVVIFNTNGQGTNLVQNMVVSVSQIGMVGPTTFTITPAGEISQ